MHYFMLIKSLFYSHGTNISRQRRIQRRAEAREVAEEAVQEEASVSVHEEAEIASVDQAIAPLNNADQ